MRTIYDWMRANLPPKPFIVEVGAHHAEDSLSFFAMFPTASIVAWEPDPRNVEVIEASTILKNFRFVLIPAAAGDFDGETTLHLSGGIPAGATGADRNREWTYSSSIRKPKEHLTAHPSVAFVGEARVKVRRLDSVMLPLIDSAVDFIWADVQGAEADMIRGGIETLKRTRYLFTEFDNRELYEGQANLETILGLLGPAFSVVRFFENNVLVRNNEAPA